MSSKRAAAPRREQLSVRQAPYVVQWRRRNRVFKILVTLALVGLGGSVIFYLLSAADFVSQSDLRWAR